MIKTSDIQSVIDMVIADVVQELAMQGHSDTGYLAQSMKRHAAGLDNEIVLQAYAASYITELNEGVEPGKIRVGQAEFEGLKGWVKRKIGAKSDSEASQIASAIVKSWKKHGKPSVNSKVYSQTGETLGAVDIAQNENEDKYISFLDQRTEEVIDKEFLKEKSSTI